MSRRIVFIAIENFNRELAGKKLLARELSLNGYVVFIGHKSILRSLLKIFPQKNHIFIDKGVTVGSSKRIKRLKKAGMFIFSFDEEALMQTDCRRYSRFNHEQESIKNIDGIFCWGPNHKQMLKEIGYENKQIIQTGNPRFDIYKLKKKTKINNHKKYILICSRFCMLRASEMQANNEDFIGPTRTIYKEFLGIPKLIRESNIVTPILIRPHPSEPINDWISATKNLRDISISNKGPLSKIFQDSILMIHNRSTSGIEAYISGLPVISFEPIELDEPPHPPKEFITSFSNYVANSKKEVIKNIDNILKGKSLLKTNKNSVNKYLFSFNELSYKKITEFIYKNYPNNFHSLFKADFILIIFLILIIYIYHYFLKMFLRIFNYDQFQYTKNKRGKFFNDENLKESNRKIKKFRFCSVDIYFPCK